MRMLQETQVAGMNLAYVFFPLTHFLDAMVEFEIQSIELWGGMPHLYADDPDVDLEFVAAPDDLRAAAAIIVPGTKSTVADLVWLRARGLAAALVQAVAAGTPVTGICGGYQMLGRRILDPEGVESTAGEVAGLGLLDVETTFLPRSARCG